MGLGIVSSRSARRRLLPLDAPLESAESLDEPADRKTSREKRRKQDQRGESSR